MGDFLCNSCVLAKRSRNVHVLGVGYVLAHVLAGVPKRASQNVQIMVLERTDSLQAVLERWPFGYLFAHLTPMAAENVRPPRQRAA